LISPTREKNRRSFRARPASCRSRAPPLAREKRERSENGGRSFFLLEEEEVEEVGVEAVAASASAKSSPPLFSMLGSRLLSTSFQCSGVVPSSLTPTGSARTSIICTGDEAEEGKEGESRSEKKGEAATTAVRRRRWRRQQSRRFPAGGGSGRSASRLERAEIAMSGRGCRCGRFRGIAAPGPGPGGGSTPGGAAGIFSREKSGKRNGL